MGLCMMMFYHWFQLLVFRKSRIGRDFLYVCDMPGGVRCHKQKVLIAVRLSRRVFTDVVAHVVCIGVFQIAKDWLSSVVEVGQRLLCICIFSGRLQLLRCLM